jgi:predicted SnoaL-like aldol condensation-catalyzing enzyme
MSEAMKVTARRFFQEVVSEGRLDVIPELVEEGFVEHEAMPGAPEGRPSIGWFVTAFRTAVPDLRVEVEDLIAEDDRLVARSTWSGTHEGELFGMPATGKPFAMGVIDIVRFEGDRVVEHWGITDVAGMMQQVGLAP